MKKLTTLLLTITLLFCACQKESKIEYTIYTDASWGVFDANSVVSSEKIKENIAFERLGKKDFDYTSKNTIKDNAAPINKVLGLDGKTFSISLVKSYTTSISTSTIGKAKSVGTYDSYKYVNDANPNDGITVEFFRGTDKVAFFSHLGNLRYEEEGTFTEQQAKEKADTLITELYGKETLSSYTHKKTYTSEGQWFKGFSVSYSRFAHGYETDENILIKFNRQGELVSINAMKLNLFDNAQNDITKAEIEAAEKALHESINDEWVLYDDSKSIVMDSTGQYFFKIYGSIKNDDDSFSSFYININ